MSLVGNLADLGLGDILQIISLSQKSGTLQLATPTDSGAIGFVQGKVVSAVREHSEGSVSDILLSGGLVTASTLQEILALQANKPQSAQSQPPLLWEAFKLSIDAIEALFKKQLEQLVFEMFTWDEGNFSFVVAEDPREVQRLKVSSNVFTVMRGLNPQYLAMEGARIKDEKQRADPFDAFMAQNGTKEAPKKKDQEEIVERLEQLAEQAPPPKAPVPVVPDIVPSATALGKAPPPAPLAKPPAPTAAAPAPPPAQAPPAPAKKEEPIAEPVAAKQMRAACEVILIDDDPNMLRGLRERLLPIVPSLSVFTKVDAGLKRMRELLWAKRICMVVCDLILPRSDGAGILGGLEALEKIRPDFPDVPVILLFDYPNDEAKEKAEKLHVTAIVTKPRRAELEKDKTRAILDEPVRQLYKALEPFVLDAQAKAAAAAEDPDEPEEDLFEKTERIAPIERTAPNEEGSSVERKTVSELKPQAEVRPESRPLAQANAQAPSEDDAFDITLEDLDDATAARLTGKVKPIPRAAQPAASAAVKATAPAPAQQPTPADVPPVSDMVDLTDEAELIELTKDITIDLGDEFDARHYEPSPDRALVVLKSLLFELMSPSSRDTIMLLVLRYAAELFSRATLLLVARDELWGLGGFSQDVKTADFVALVKKLKVAVEPGSAAYNTLKTRSAHRQPLNKTETERQLAKVLGVDPDKEIFVAPLLSADRVAAILLGDNQQVGKDLGDTHGLEIFLLQAGMAMERALLERRLKELARKES